MRKFISKMHSAVLKRFPEIDNRSGRESSIQAVQEVNQLRCSDPLSLLIGGDSCSQAVFPHVFRNLFAIYQRKNFFKDAEFSSKVAGRSTMLHISS